MLVKGFFVVCIQAVLIKAVLTQCMGSPLIGGETLLLPNMALDGLVPNSPVVSRIVGANLIVDTSAQDPSGVSIFSDDLIIEGTVLVTGNLPFLGTVAVEGVVPAVGSSAVAYECGTGNFGITSDAPIANLPPLMGLGVPEGVNRVGLGVL